MKKFFLHIFNFNVPVLQCFNVSVLECYNVSVFQRGTRRTRGTRMPPATLSICAADALFVTVLQYSIQSFTVNEKFSAKVFNLTENFERYLASLFAKNRNIRRVGSLKIAIFGELICGKFVYLDKIKF